MNVRTIEKLLENKIQLKCKNPQFDLLNNERSKYDTTATILFFFITPLFLSIYKITYIPLYNT